MENNSKEKHPYLDRRRLSIIRDFFRVTSIHGLPAIARGDSPRNIVFWSLIFLVFFASMLYFVTVSILAYFAYPTQTNVDITIEYPMIFPALTVCNYGVIRSDLFIGPFINYVISIGAASSNSSVAAILSIPNLPYLIDQFFVDIMNRNGSISDYMFSLNEILYSCTYNGLNCNASNFVQFISSEYGYCYTFNAKTDGRNGNTSLRTSADNGGQGVLQLEFYIYDYLSFPNFRSGFGIIAMVHDNVQVPQIDINGLGFAPGLLHTLQFSKETISFLSAPYTNCTTEIRADMQAMFNTYFIGTEYEYSRQICLDLCAEAYVYSICNCTSPLYWSERTVLLSNGEVIFATLCNITDTCVQKALNTFLNDVVMIDQQCSYCTSECELTSFNVQLSSILAPGVYKQLALKQWVESNSLINSSRRINLPPGWIYNSSSYIQQNYVGLQVVLSTSLVGSYTQSATLSWADVISNVGGQTGLWIGVSMLSLVELLETVYRLIRHFIHRRFRKKQEITRY